MDSKVFYFTAFFKRKVEKDLFDLFVSQRGCFRWNRQLVTNTPVGLFRRLYSPPKCRNNKVHHFAFIALEEESIW